MVRERCEKDLLYRSREPPKASIKAVADAALKLLSAVIRPNTGGTVEYVYLLHPISLG